MNTHNIYLKNMKGASSEERIVKELSKLFDVKHVVACSDTGTVSLTLEGEAVLYSCKTILAGMGYEERKSAIQTRRIDRSTKEDIKSILKKLANTTMVKASF